MVAARPRCSTCSCRSALFFEQLGSLHSGRCCGARIARAPGFAMAEASPALSGFSSRPSHRRRQSAVSVRTRGVALQTVIRDNTAALAARTVALGSPGLYSFVHYCAAKNNAALNFVVSLHKPGLTRARRLGGTPCGGAVASRRDANVLTPHGRNRMCGPIAGRREFGYAFLPASSTALISSALMPRSSMSSFSCASN